MTAQSIRLSRRVSLIDLKAISNRPKSPLLLDKRQLVINEAAPLLDKAQLMAKNCSRLRRHQFTDGDMCSKTKPI